MKKNRIICLLLIFSSFILAIGQTIKPARTVQKGKSSSTATTNADDLADEGGLLGAWSTNENNKGFNNSKLEEPLILFVEDKVQNMFGEEIARWKTINDGTYVIILGDVSYQMKLEGTTKPFRLKFLDQQTGEVVALLYKRKYTP